ncbi:MAG: DUF192 domain-containing protein [Alphaproteobacteria bacterium]|nr:DUF192 domain-containing protein [Alphaproteobacteria bacterium]
MCALRLPIYFFAALVSVLLAGLSTLDAQTKLEKLIIETRSIPISFDVEIMSTDAERQRGLMGRVYLPQQRGMLFDFGVPEDVRMWMKDTPLPLDIIFIRADGTIARITKGEPFSTRVLPSGEPVLAVLELNGGTSTRLNIQPGNVVRHKLFGTAN